MEHKQLLEGQLLALIEWCARADRGLTLSSLCQALELSGTQASPELCGFAIPPGVPSIASCHSAGLLH